MRRRFARLVFDFGLRSSELRIGMFLSGRAPFPNTWHNDGGDAFGDVVQCSEDVAYALHVAYRDRAIYPV